MQVTTGARSDLQRATRWARHMVAECGMSDAIGPLFADQHVRLCSDIGLQNCSHSLLLTALLTAPRHRLQTTGRHASVRSKSSVALASVASGTVQCMFCHGAKAWRANPRRTPTGPCGRRRTRSAASTARWSAS